VLPRKLSGNFVKCEEFLIYVEAFRLMDHISVCKPQSDLYNLLDESVETVVSDRSLPCASTSSSSDNLLNEKSAIGKVFNINCFKDMNI
jgi:hypothetical protein